MRELNVIAPVQRQILHELAGDGRAERRAVGLQSGQLGGDLDGFRSLSNLHFRVHASAVARYQGEFNCKCLEARHLDAHGVTPDRQQVHNIITPLVGGDGSGDIRAKIGDCDLRAGYNCSGGIGYSADHVRCGHLRSG